MKAPFQKTAMLRGEDFFQTCGVRVRYLSRHLAVATAASAGRSGRSSALPVVLVRGRDIHLPATISAKQIAFRDVPFAKAEDAQIAELAGKVSQAGCFRPPLIEPAKSGIWNRSCNCPSPDSEREFSSPLCARNRGERVAVEPHEHGRVIRARSRDRGTDLEKSGSARFTGPGGTIPKHRSAFGKGERGASLGQKPDAHYPAFDRRRLGCIVLRNREQSAAHKTFAGFNSTSRRGQCDYVAFFDEN